MENIFNTVKNNIDEILNELHTAAQSAGRDPASIKLMAVTKTKPIEYVEAAHQAGLRLFGENRVQELEEKFISFNQNHSDSQIHLIGHLQRNKVKKAVPVAHSIDSIDKYETAEEIAKWCKTENKTMDILLEYNTSLEESKSGFKTGQELFEAVDKIRGLGNLNIKGLMTIAPLTDSELQIRKAFKLLKTLFDKISGNHSDLKMDTLSMGMSSDFKIAIQEGSTLVRIGTRLFGSRN